MSFVGFLDFTLPILLNICRETSNKALNAINELHLVPFLMSFLAARNRLPLAPVTSAGTCIQKKIIRFTNDVRSKAQCLYVLTDDNYPAISDVKTDASCISCLLSIAREVNADPRTVTLSVLAAGEQGLGQ